MKLSLIDWLGSLENPVWSQQISLRHYDRENLSSLMAPIWGESTREQRKKSSFSLLAPLWGKSTGHLWSLTKGQ